MKQFFFPVFLASVLLASTFYAQGLESPIKVYPQRLETPVKVVRPDLSGTWNLNYGKSELKDIGSKALADEARLILTVDQKTPIINVKVMVRHQARSVTGPEFNIYTDGRASEIPTGRTASSGIAEWNDSKLVLTVFASPKDGNTLFVEVGLSADRNTLIFTLIRKLTRTGLDGKSLTIVDHTRDITMIYDRIVDIPAGSIKIPLPEENKQR